MERTQFPRFSDKYNKAIVWEPILASSSFQMHFVYFILTKKFLRKNIFSGYVQDNDNVW